MNENNQLSERTVSLLRAPMPDHDPRPGFETRLMAHIHEAATPKAARFASRWILGGLATAVLVVGIAATLLRPAPPEPIAVAPPVESLPAPAETRPVLELDKFANPLEAEALAMRSSVTRVSRFLINCFPSLPDPEDESL